MTIQIQPAKIGKGKAIHAGIINEGNAYTLCRVNHWCNETGATVPAEGEITCKKCLKELGAEIERDHAEAMEENKVREFAAAAGELKAADLAASALLVQLVSPLAHWVADRSGMWRGEDGSLLTCDLPVRRGTFGHEGPCFDRVAGVQRQALTLSRRQRKTARRAQRAKLRRTAPQTRAAGSARRVRRGAARATVTTLLMATGVPQDVARRYAPAFSRGVQAPTASTRIRIGEHRSKRVEVKRYDWALFVETLERFVTSSRRQSFEVMPVFRAARERVTA
jgi:hypothetical protein